MASGLDAIFAELRNRLASAITETVNESFEDLDNNVGHFYNSAEGSYHRTGQLAESPQIDYIRIAGDSAEGQLSLNTSHTYSPSGRDTETIYTYGEDGGLLGNGGFWAKTEEDIENNINSIFGKYFS